MQLNHLDLSVPDVIETKNFFEKFLDFKSINPKESNSIAVLKNEKGFTLVLQKFKDDRNNTYPENFHIGFMLDNIEELYKIYEKLKSEYQDFDSKITSNNRGTMFYFFAPGKILIEINYSDKK